MLFEKIQEKIWGLSVSAGTSPYTYLSFQIDEALKNTVAENLWTGYTQGIAFFLWENYTLEDLKDHIKYSKEYLLIADNLKREEFLHQQISKNLDQFDFLQWQHNQMYIAFGFALNEINTAVIKYKEVEPWNIDQFKQTIHIENGVLKEILLF